MIAKITKGSSFGIAVNYVADTMKQTLIIDHDGLRTIDAPHIIRSFEAQAKLNPKIGKPVGHISLSFSIRDKDRLTNSIMVEIAREYMNKMGICNTQYIIGRHFDKEHPHIHILYNRVDNKGKTISDRNDRFRSAKICKELTLSHNLYLPLGKGNVKTYRLREPDRSRYQIYQTLEQIVPKCTNWNDLIKQLETQGIKTEFKYKGQSNEIQGVTFIKNGFRFNGSKVDKKYSYSKTDFQLRHNRQQQINHIQRQRFAKNTGKSEYETGNRHTGSLFSSAKYNYMNGEEENTTTNKKRKKGRSI